MIRARFDKGELNCPCCNRVMFFQKLETWDEYAARHRSQCGREPGKFPDEIGEALATVDHLIPRTRGGPVYARSNLFVMCGACNGEKDNMTAREWIAWRKSEGRPLDDAAAARLSKRERLASKSLAHAIKPRGVYHVG